MKAFEIALVAMVLVGSSSCSGTGTSDASSPDGGPGQGAGGNGTGTGGASSGGTVGSGGDASGGASDSGGVRASGGAPASGGTNASGGDAASGGSGNTGTGGVTQVEGGAGGSIAQPPSDVLDLADWKLTLPVGSPGRPTEIEQPALDMFSLSPYFELNTARDGVVFQANAGGVTTMKSDYPRSELREMTNSGADNAAWSTTSGNHTMTITEAITHLPEVKHDVVAGQIHDAASDVVMIRLEGAHLFVEGDGTELGDLEPSYVLGTRFTVRIAASNGEIRIYYQDLGTPKVTVQRSTDGCYFKAGVYTQSNPSKGDTPTAYGEVVIYDLSVAHQ